MTAALSIVEDNSLRQATEPFEGVTVAGDPGRNPLVEDQLGVLVATERERHHEEIRRALQVPDRVVEWFHRAEVDLGLLARGCLDPDEDLGRLGTQVANEATDRGVAPSVAVALP